MADKNVTLVLPSGGTRNAEVPDDVAVKELVPELATTLELPTFNEEIEVYVQDGQLKTDHSFFLGEFRFLTLRYDIRRP